MILLQEPTDSLEETLLLPQMDFCIGADIGNEGRDNPSGTHTDNPSNPSTDDASMYCTRCGSNKKNVIYNFNNIINLTNNSQIWFLSSKLLKAFNGVSLCSS